GDDTGSQFSLPLVLREVALAGFVGLEIGSRWPLGTPQECQAILGRYGLQLQSLPLVAHGPTFDVAAATAQARFAQAMGVRQMMLCGPFGRPAGGKPSAEELQALCRACDEVARRVADHGVRAGYHNHLGTPVEQEDELDYFMEHTAAVGYYPDLGHARAAGWDPLPSLQRYGQRICGGHLKDVLVDPQTGRLQRFIELGKGNAGLNVEGCLEAMGREFHGWVFVAQDHTSLNPGLDALENYRYLWQRGYVP
ncbi:MAG: TIM barrel protein, partial [Chloroflexi bacterium]|nr:TIM barrel protein [Chloroflexota bacterium]